MIQIKIYIAGPYDASTREQVKKNIERIEMVGIELVKLGHIPFMPHKLLAHWDVKTDFHREIFLKIDLEWLKLCDALFFVAESPGANKEREVAEMLHMPIFYSLDEVKAFKAKV